MTEELRLSVAFAAGVIISFIFVNGIGGTLLQAQESYDVCIADGGTRDHCVDKYLLSGKPKP